VLKLSSFAFADIPFADASAPARVESIPSRDPGWPAGAKNARRESSYNRHVAELLNYLRGDQKEFR
jgi:hypothetical protein